MQSEMSLHYACESGDTLAAIALIERGANVNEKNQIGWNPLHFACLNSHSVTAIALLKNGAVGVNDKDICGITPSYSACLRCTADVVIRMTRQGAILTAADLQRFRDQPTVTEEQVRTVEVAYKRENYWRRHAHYAMFLKMTNAQRLFESFLL